MVKRSSFLNVDEMVKPKASLLEHMECYNCIHLRYFMGGWVCVLHYLACDQYCMFEKNRREKELKKK